MRKPLWIIQRGIFDDQNPEKMIALLGEMEIPYKEVTLHNLQLWDVKKQKKLEITPGELGIAYGSLTFAHNIMGTYLIPGIWLDQDEITCRKYYSAWGQYLIQKRYGFYTFAEVGRLRHDLWSIYATGRAGVDGIFIRPDSNMKIFPGLSLKYSEFDNFYTTSQISCEPTTLCVVAQAVNISNEWRLVVSNGKVITGSQYRQNGEVVISPDCPDEVKEFAEKVLASSDYNPHPVFCLDIGEVDGEYGVIEIGSVNTSGLYDCDLRAIIKTVNTCVEREHKELVRG